MKHCTAYRRRGPTAPRYCTIDHAPDRSPEVTACIDLSVWDAIVRNPVAGQCAAPTAGCA
jgi:hypothetical protein